MKRTYKRYVGHWEIQSILFDDFPNKLPDRKLIYLYDVIVTKSSVNTYDYTEILVEAERLDGQIMECGVKRKVDNSEYFIMDSKHFAFRGDLGVGGYYVEEYFWCGGSRWWGIIHDYLRLFNYYEFLKVRGIPKFNQEPLEFKGISISEKTSEFLKLPSKPLNELSLDNEVFNLEKQSPGTINPDKNFLQGLKGLRKRPEFLLPEIQEETYG
jgi:hypothetical protein